MTARSGPPAPAEGPGHHLGTARWIACAFGRYLWYTRTCVEPKVTLRELATATGIRADILTRIEHGRMLATPEEHQILSDWLLQHAQSEREG